ncbi:MAG: SHOCT domain-containing protein [Acidovorax sp.]|nr:SHOCT domain-containing protein [Acidovorax sp.]
MQFILFLLSLFAIGCVLYGISAGVQVVQRGFNALASNDSDSKTAQEPQHLPQPPAAPLTSKGPDTATLPQRCINELQALFDLYQSGALTQQEFEKCKWHVLHSMTDGEAKHG